MLRAYPEACKLKDGRGRLPLDYALAAKAPPEVIAVVHAANNLTYRDEIPLKSVLCRVGRTLLRRERRPRREQRRLRLRLLAPVTSVRSSKKVEAEASMERSAQPKALVPEISNVFTEPSEAEELGTRSQLSSLSFNNRMGPRPIRR